MVMTLKDSFIKFIVYDRDRVYDKAHPADLHLVISEEVNFKKCRNLKDIIQSIF